MSTVCAGSVIACRPRRRCCIHIRRLLLFDSLAEQQSLVCVLAFRSHVVFLAAVFVLVVVYSLARR